MNVTNGLAILAIRCRKQATITTANGDGPDDGGGGGRPDSRVVAFGFLAWAFFYQWTKKHTRTTSRT